MFQNQLSGFINGQCVKEAQLKCISRTLIGAKSTTCRFRYGMLANPGSTGDSQLVPMSTRHMSTRTHVNSYPCQLVPPTDVNSYHK